MLMAAKSDNLKNSVNEEDGFLKELEDFEAGVDLLKKLMVERESAHQRAEGVLQDELKRREEVLEAKDSAIRKLEESVSARVRDLGSRLSEKEELLNSRDGELEGFKSQVSALTERLAKMKSAKERAESSLLDELRRSEEMVQVRDSAIRIRELEESLTAKIQDRKNQPGEKGQFDPFEMLLDNSK